MIISWYLRVKNKLRRARLSATIVITFVSVLLLLVRRTNFFLKLHVALIHSKMQGVLFYSFHPLPSFPRCPLHSRQEAAGGELQRWTLTKGGNASWRETVQPPPAAGRNESCGWTLWRRRQTISPTWMSPWRWVFHFPLTRGSCQ